MVQENYSETLKSVEIRASAAEMAFNAQNSETWDWQGTSSILDDDFDVPKCLWNSANQPEDISFLFEGPVTPTKDCGDFSYYVNDSEIKPLDECEERSSRAKRRRTLQFDSEGFDNFSLGDMSCAGGRSKGRAANPVVENSSELSNWDLENAESTLSASGYKGLDQTSEAWIASLFSDVDTEIISKDKISSDQIDTAEISNEPSVSAAAVSNGGGGGSALTRRHGLKGRKSYMKTPTTNLKSYVAYPFSFLKPSSFHGAVTLKDINRGIKAPPASSSKQSCDDLGAYPTSAFSGKPVVGTTTIPTEGGRGAITILRTRG